MCEMLIFVGDLTHPDPVKDRGCWKLGMVVDVKEDGAAWGTHESKQAWIASGKTAASWPNQGRLAILKVPGVPAAKARVLTEGQLEDDSGAPYYETIPEANPRRTAYRLREWLILLDSVPAGIRSTVGSSGEVTVTRAQIRNYLRRIRDDAQFTGLD